MALTDQHFFITGGALPLDALSYVVREADRLLYVSLRTGEFCYILDTRQSGKSSLKVRTAIRLRQEGITVVDLDLTRIGQPSLAEQWYYGLLLDIGDQLNILEPLRQFWQAHKTDIAPLQRWLLALRQVVLEHSPGRLVLFIDEIDVVRSLPFSTDEFFAGIREIYHRRVQDPAYTRIAFCLLGVAAPTDLIRDVRTTPFNIGQRVELNDFTTEEAAAFEYGLRSRPGLDRSTVSKALLERVLYWTGGHPYLTQRLCRALVDTLSETALRPGLSPVSRVDRLCADLFLTAKARETDDNLAFVSNRILRGSGDVAALLTVYQQVQSGGRIRDDSANPLIRELKLAGIVQVQAGLLQIRNRIYAREFDAAWVRESMPDAEVQRQRAAYRQGLIRAGSTYGIVMLIICGMALAALRQKQFADRNAKYAHTAETRSRMEAARANQEAANARRQLYFANMELAPREWENSRVGHLLQLLQETKDNENRNWEWNYWNRVCHSELLVIPIQGEIASAALSPDGKYIAIPNESTVLIVDAITGRQISRVGQRNSSASVNSAAYSPDGQCLVTGNGDSSVRLWDIKSGRMLLKVRGSIGPVTMVAFANNGKYLFCSGFGGTLEVWDKQSGKNLRQLIHVGAVAPSPDGLLAVSGGNDGIARMWSIATGRQLATAPGSGSGITSVAYSSDGQSIAVGTMDGMVRVRDAVTMRELLKLKHSDDRVSVAFSSDNKRLLTYGYDGTAKVWDMRSGRRVLTLRHPAQVQAGSFFPNGQKVVTVSGKDTVRIWDAESDRHTVRFKAHPAYAIAIAFSPNGKQIVSVGDDANARVWDVATGRKLLECKGPNSSLYAVTYSPDGKRIVTGSDNSTARVWDATTGKSLFVLKGRAGWVNSVAWSPDGRLIATAHNNNVAKVWNADTGLEIRTLHGDTDHVLSVAFSPDSTHLLTASADYHAKVWDLADGRESLSVTGSNWLWSAAFSPDGRRIVVGCQDDSAKVYDVVTGREMLTLQGHTSNVRAVAFSPDGKRIVTASHDGTLRMWDAANGRESLLLAHPNAIYAVAFSRDSRRIATGSAGGSVQIWSEE